MSRVNSRGYAYARASARGVFVGLLLSVAVVAPFAMSAADPTDPQPTNPPASQPVNLPTAQPESTAQPEPTVEPTSSASEAPSDVPAPTSLPGSTDGPYAPTEPEPTSAPTAAPTPATSVSFLITFTTNDAFASRAVVFGLLGLTEERSIAPLRMASVSVPAEDAAAAAHGLRANAGVGRVESEAERAIEALKRMAGGLCPGCEHPIAVSTADAPSNFCVHCGMTLFDHCTACHVRKNAFFQYCPACGAPAEGVAPPTAAIV